MAGQEPEFPSPPARSMPHSILTAGGILLTIGGLYFGRELFIPFTLAVLLAFALSPIINALRRWRVPRVTAVIMTVILAFSVIGGLSYVLSTQVLKLAELIPRYQSTMINKIDSIFDSGATGGLLERLTSTLERVRSRLAENEETSQLGSPPQPSEQGRDAPEPIPVTTCFMLTSGKRLDCDTNSKFILPIYEHAAYGTGDDLSLPLFDLNSEPWTIGGTVRGKALYEGRQVLLIDFAGTRNEVMQGTNYRVDVSGYAYLDTATGFPLVMSITMDIQGPMKNLDRVVVAAEVVFAIGTQ